MYILGTNNCPVIASGTKVVIKHIFNFPASNKIFITLEDLENFTINNRGQPEEIYSTILYDNSFTGCVKLVVNSLDKLDSILKELFLLGYKKLSWFADFPSEDHPIYLLIDHTDKVISSFPHNPSSEYVQHYVQM